MGPVVTEGASVLANVSVISPPYAGITRSGSYGRRPRAVLSAHSACAPASLWMVRTRRYPHCGPHGIPTAHSLEVPAEAFAEWEIATVQQSKRAQAAPTEGSERPHAPV